MILRPTYAWIAVAALLALAACDSAEERAEKHFQNAVELLDAGDVDRAVVEFRNVFQLNTRHLEARRLFARTMLEHGELQQAFGSYLMVSEQLPSDLESRIALARVAYQTRNWEDFRRYGTAAHELAPQDPDARVVWGAIEYREAVLDEDPAARRDAVRSISDLISGRPNDRLLREVLIDGLIRDGELERARDEIDSALEIWPGDEELLRVRLGALLQLEDEGAIERQMQELASSFPDNVEYRQSLIQWHVSRGDIAEARSLLEELAYAEDASTEDRVNFLAFVESTQGPEAALDEVERLIGAGRDVLRLRAMKAGIEFDQGNRERAIAELESVIAGSESSDRLRDVKVALARMLAAAGDEAGARQRVDEVLAEDASNIEALKMRAGWQIGQDQPEKAILALRSALDQAPRDPQIMSLMANAYLRSGSRELAGEMLSLAVDASGKAPPESLRYAAFLIEDGKFDTAEATLVDALRTSPGNVDVLVELGRVRVGQQDWSGAEQVEGTLRRLETDAGTAAADNLRLARLQGQQRTEEALAFLDSVLVKQGARGAAELAIVQTHLRNGDVAAAEGFVDRTLVERPADAVMRFLKASILSMSDKGTEAEAIYRGLLSEDDSNEVVWQTLYALLASKGRNDEARQVLEEGLAAIPGSANLQWALAGDLERLGDIEAAISIYESLYEENSDSPIIANNLASLIATYRTDEASLERAWAIARRLRGANRPEFQDTYGWIAFRRGEVDEAIQNLEPAARGLKDDPIVQYHLAVAYERAGRTDEALEQFRRAVEVAGEADSRPQFKRAREEIARLETLTGDAQSR